MKKGKKILSGVSAIIPVAFGTTAATELISTIKESRDGVDEDYEVSEEELDDFYKRIKSARAKRIQSLGLNSVWKYIDTNYVSYEQNIEPLTKTSILDSYEDEKSSVTNGNYLDIYKKLHAVNEDLRLHVVNWKSIEKNKAAIISKIRDVLIEENNNSSTPLSEDRFEKYFNEIVNEWDNKISFAATQDLNEKDFKDYIDEWLSKKFSNAKIQQISADAELSNLLKIIERDVVISKNVYLADSLNSLMQWSNSSSTTLKYSESAELRNVLKQYFGYKNDFVKGDNKDDIKFDDSDYKLTCGGWSLHFYNHLYSISNFDIGFLENNLNANYKLEIELLPFSMQREVYENAFQPFSKAFFAQQKIPLTFKITITSKENESITSSDNVTIFTPISDATKNDFVYKILNDGKIFGSFSTIETSTLGMSENWVDDDLIVNKYHVSNDDLKNMSTSEKIARYAGAYNANLFFSNYNKVGQIISPTNANDLVNMYVFESPKDQVAKFLSFNDINAYLKNYGYQMSLKLEVIDKDYTKINERWWAGIQYSFCFSTLQNERWSDGKNVLNNFIFGHVREESMLYIDDNTNEKITVVESLVQMYDTFKAISEWEFSDKSMNALSQYADGNLAISTISLACAVASLGLAVGYALCLNIPASATSVLVGVVTTILGAISVASSVSLFTFKNETKQYYKWFNTISKDKIIELLPKLENYRDANVANKFQYIDSIIEISQQISKIGANDFQSWGMPANSDRSNYFKTLANALEVSAKALIPLANLILNAAKFVVSSNEKWAAKIPSVSMDDFKRDVVEPLRHFASRTDQSSNSLNYAVDGIKTIISIFKGGIKSIIDCAKTVSVFIKAAKYSTAPGAWAVPLVVMVTAAIEGIMGIIDIIFQNYFRATDYWY